MSPFPPVAPRSRRSIAAALFVLWAAGPAAAVVPGQSDDFESETAEEWTIGLAGVPVQVTGGPDGAGDAYLEPSATGTGGAGQRLVIFNQAQWTGDFTAAGVNVIRLDALHVSGSDVSLRIALTGLAGSVVTAQAIPVASPGMWQTLEFSLDPAALVLLSGSGDVASVLADTDHFRILHSDDLPAIGPGGYPAGEPIAATIGIDNVTAVPEPDAALQALGCLAAIALLARRRAGRAREGSPAYSR